MRVVTGDEGFGGALFSVQRARLAAGASQVLRAGRISGAAGDRQCGEVSREAVKGLA